MCTADLLCMEFLFFFCGLNTSLLLTGEEQKNRFWLTMGVTGSKDWLGQFTAERCREKEPTGRHNKAVGRQRRRDTALGIDGSFIISSRCR